MRTVNKNTFWTIRGIEEDPQTRLLKFVHRGLCGVRDEVVTKHDDVVPVRRVLLLNDVCKPFIEVDTTELVITPFDNLNGYRATAADGKTQ